MLQSSLFVNMVCWGLLRLGAYGLGACHGGFQSCCQENHPHRKSDRDLDPQKSVCATFCLGRYNHPSIFEHFFVVFLPHSSTFVTSPRVVELVVVSAPVEHPHYVCILLDFPKLHSFPVKYYLMYSTTSY